MDSGNPFAEPHVIVVMGVAASGKSTVGQALAHALGWSFYEGDDFHSPANKAKSAWPTLHPRTNTHSESQ